MVVWVAPDPRTKSQTGEKAEEVSMYANRVLHKAHGLEKGFLTTFKTKGPLSLNRIFQLYPSMPPSSLS